MAVLFQYDAAQQLFLVTFDGELRDGELEDAFRKTQQFATHFAIRRGILDGLKIRSFEASPETIRALAHQTPMFPENTDRCVVVTQDALYGMARMYQMLGGESRERLRVVRSLEEAYDYLHLQTPLQLETIDE